MLYECQHRRVAREELRWGRRHPQPRALRAGRWGGDARGVRMMSNSGRRACSRCTRCSLTSGRGFDPAVVRRKPEGGADRGRGGLRAANEQRQAAEVVSVLVRRPIARRVRGVRFSLVPFGNSNPSTTRKYVAARTARPRAPGAAAALGWGCSEFPKGGRLPPSLRLWRTAVAVGRGGSAGPWDFPGRAAPISVLQAAAVTPVERGGD